MQKRNRTGHYLGASTVLSRTSEWLQAHATEREYGWYGRQRRRLFRLYRIHVQELVVRRAHDAGLAASYVESLLALETRSTPAALAFEPTLPDSALITLSELAESRHYVGIGGWVFDLRTVPTCPALREAFGGKDITLHLLQRHSPSCRTTFDDLRRGELEPEQRRWQNALLHELARRHALAGALSYEGDAPRDTLLGASLLGHTSSLRARRPSTLRRLGSGRARAAAKLREPRAQAHAPRPARARRGRSRPTRGRSASSRAGARLPGARLLLAVRIRAGVRVFERHDAHPPQLGASELLGICAELPLLLAPLRERRTGAGSVLWIRR